MARSIDTGTETLTAEVDDHGVGHAVAAAPHAGRLLVPRQAP